MQIMTDTYRTCLVCGSDFRPNDVLEHLGRGRRVAYDLLRGRLWQVCRSCKRWSLLPMESRWEALEELEKVVVDRARLLSRTDNVALLRAGPLEGDQGQLMFTSVAGMRPGIASRFR